MANPTEGEECPFVLMHTVPVMKYHEELHCLSEPGLTQQEYERAVWARLDSHISDEFIHIKCPDTPDGTCEVIELKRSSLLRSPTLARLIRSTHYLEGCGMIFTFLNDPAICFKSVKIYLDEGPDCFTKSHLRAYLLPRYTDIDRFLIHGRLYLLAKKLALPGLMAIAYGCLEDAERLMTASHCVMMTRLIFGAESGFDRLLKDWCIKHVANHFASLHTTKEWNELVPRLQPELRAGWGKLVLTYAAILTPIEEEANDKALEETRTLRENSHRRRVVSTNERSANEMSVEEVMNQVRSESNYEHHNEEWEDVELQARNQGKAVDGSKGKNKPGTVKTSRRARPWTKKTRAPVPDTKSAKARKLMGITQDEEKKSKKRAMAYSKRFTRFLW